MSQTPLQQPRRAPPPASAATSASASSEQGDLLLADVLNKLQVLKALTIEQERNNKPTIPLLAQSCSLLDNLPSSSSSSSSKNGVQVQWSTTQEEQIKTLRMSAWKDIADGCIRASDFVQAEACLQTLANLQAEASGPLGEKPSDRAKKSSVSPTEDQCLHAAGLVLTWDSLSKVFADMGKQDMSNNYAKRRDKLSERLSSHISAMEIK